MTDETNIKSDYDKSRETYYDLIEKGQDALSMMMEVARESEHPRAYEVLSGMIKNVADVNDKLMDLNKKNKDIQKSDAPAMDLVSYVAFVLKVLEQPITMSLLDLVQIFNVCYRMSKNYPQK